MAAIFIIITTGVLYLLSPPSARADQVTWHSCNTAYEIRRRALTTSPDLKATELYITHCSLTELTQHDFTGLPNIEGIHAEFNQISQVHSNVLKPVPKLTQLFLWKNKLRVTPYFKYCSNLQRLNLARNLLTEIGNHSTFSACTSITNLYLDNNFIEYIHPDVFKPLIELTYLYLFNNRITFVPKNAFASTKNLRELYLNDNRLAVLPVDFISDLRNLGSFTRVFFENNPWFCTCLMKLMRDVKEAGFMYHGYSYYQKHWGYNGTRPVCVMLGRHRCDAYRDNSWLLPSTNGSEH